MGEAESFQNYVHAFFYFSELNDFFVCGEHCRQDFLKQWYLYAQGGVGPLVFSCILNVVNECHFFCEHNNSCASVLSVQGAQPVVIEASTTII